MVEARHHWTGVSVDTLLAGLETEAEYVSAWCDDGYRTNLPLEDVTGGRAWIAYEFEGEPLDPEHGGPARRPRPRRDHDARPDRRRAST